MSKLAMSCTLQAGISWHRSGHEQFLQRFGERKRVGLTSGATAYQRPTSEISLCLFRVLQEALYNAVQHSGVRRDARLWGRRSDSIDGSDLAWALTSKRKAGRRLGINRMQERLKL